MNIHQRKSHTHKKRKNTDCHYSFSLSSPWRWMNVIVNWLNKRFFKFGYSHVPFYGLWPHQVPHPNTRKTETPKEIMTTTAEQLDIQMTCLYHISQNTLPQATQLLGRTRKFIIKKYTCQIWISPEWNQVRSNCTEAQHWRTGKKKMYHFNGRLTNLKLCSPLMMTLRI